MSLVRMAQICAVVGLDLAARAYPGAPPVRDVAQIALLSRLRARLGPGLRWTIEAPVVEMAIDGKVDLRAWDGLIEGDGWRVAVEAETRVRDIQALIRRVELKLRDGRVAGVLIVLNDTEHHRGLLRESASLLRQQFAGSPRRALRALGRGARPPLRTVILL